MSIYERAIRALEADGLLSNSDKVLASCAGDTDPRAFQRFEYRDVINLFPM